MEVDARDITWMEGYLILDFFSSSFLERQAPYKALCMGVRGRAGGTNSPGYPVYLFRSYHGYSINNR